VSLFFDEAEVWFVNRLPYWHQSVWHSGVWVVCSMSVFVSFGFDMIICAFLKYILGFWWLVSEFHTPFSAHFK